MLASLVLKEMTYPEIMEYLEYSQREYAQGMLDQGEYPDYETALRAGRAEINYNYTHAGPGESHYTYNLLNAQTGQKVGLFGFSILIRRNSKEPFVFVDYITIMPEFRRRGYAQFAMRWLENWTREQGLKRIELNVMKHKKGAVKLYQSLGYEVYQERALGLSKEPGRYDMRKSI